MSTDTDIPTPIDTWGKDHWSTYAYAHTRAVDYKGVLSRAHMRGCNDGMFAISTPAGKYPTRLKGGMEIQNHSDLDCLLDAEAYELLTVEPYDGTYRVVFTDKGNVLAGKLFAHKADGGRWANFDPGTNLGLHVAGRLAS